MVLRLGSRGSPLALAQAAEVRARLAAAHPALGAPDAIVVVPIRTSGDRLTQGSLAAAGGKGLFTKEIEEALRGGVIDLAVHSLKDMETALSPGLCIAAHLPREDPRDALIARDGAAGLAALPPGALVGTASIRRKAQLLHARRDLRVVPLRGNVGTRLQKLAAGEVEATLLAIAGLKRLGSAACVSCVLPAEEMLPAAGQGVIAVEARSDDVRTLGLLFFFDDTATAAAAGAERALLAALDGSCRTPIAALARLEEGRLVLDAMVIKPDGSELLRTRRVGAPGEARALGGDAGAELRARAGPGYFEASA